MNKKLTAAFTALITASTLIATSTAKAEAEDLKPTIAILDTALDNKVATLQGRIAYEVCVLDFNTCPNGKNYMEGAGSAYLPYNIISQNGFDHGTQMTSIFTQNNPDVNVVFVRIVGNTPTGARQITNESTFVNALNWVINNQSKFNIQAVSMSQGHHNLGTGVNYCPNTPNTTAKINQLVSMGVPVFLPAGNGRDLTRIDWPACIDSSVSIGAATDYDEIPLWSNVDMNKTDLYALGATTAMLPGTKQVNAIGTSVAVQIAAAQWLKLKKAKPTLTYQQTLDLLKSKATTIPGLKGTSGKLINIGASING